MSALNEQVEGSHYKDLCIQPMEYCHLNGLGPAESSAIKYLTRYQLKGGLSDLRKAIHCIEMLIEMEYPATARAKDE